tara:strand:+ start:20 stop:667 length:648 start_codon:yes stop_codon:yes gene_type:complete
MTMPETKTKKETKLDGFNMDLFNLYHELNNPGATADNPYFKNKYADLLTIIKTVKPILYKHGFILFQVVKQPSVLSDSGSKTPLLKTILRHISGESIEDEGVPLVCKNPADPQQQGSAITYARRYGMQSILGIVADTDDDGQAASGKTEKDINRLKQEFTDTIHESADKAMLDKLYLTYKDEIEALTKEDQKWFQNSYKEQIKFMKEREVKNANS